MSEAIRNELLDLQQDGLLQVETAVQWAKEHESSALYRSLEWDDTVAGHLWRCQQVRRLIAVHVIGPDRVRQLVSLTIDRTHEGGGYRLTADVLAASGMRSILLRDALNELERVRRKYESLTELAKVWEAAEHVRREHEREKELESEDVA